MKRLLAAAALLFGLASAQTADPLQPVFEFIKAQPQDVALQVTSMGADGTPRTAFAWNAAQPMPLASSMKIVVLAAYAQAVVAGRLDPSAQVTLREWEQFYLAEQDGGAHAASLELLGIPADQYGRALDPQRTVTLDTLARFMIETSDNAATDVLLTRLGKGKIRETVKLLGLKQQGDIGPIAGMFTAWDREGANYLQLTPSQQREHDWNWAAQVTENPSWRLPPIQKRSLWYTARQLEEDEKGLALHTRLHNETPPLGSVADYTDLMNRVLTGSGFQPAELDIMRRHLNWPMRVNPRNATIFNAVYGKGGSLGLGVLTGNYGLEFKNGNRIAVSVFFRDIPLERSEEMRSGFDAFILGILNDPAAQQKLKGALGLK